MTVGDSRSSLIMISIGESVFGNSRFQASQGDAGHISQMDKRK